jgi:UDP-glucuronate 4-epimerase
MIAKLYNRLYNINTIGLRFFTVYGPRGRPDMAPYKFLKSIIEEKKIDKYGDGNTFRDYTYIDDIISGIIGAIDNKNNKSCEIYNLGNGNPITLNKFIEICENIVNKKAIINQMDEQLGDVPATYADISKARKDLDYNPQTTFEEGIRKTYEYLMLL